MSQQGLHPFQLQLQSMSNKIGAMENHINRLAADNQALRQMATESKILGEVLKNTQVSGKQLGGGDFKANKAWAKAWGGSDYVSLDAIQGRFIPFDLFTEIIVPDNASTTLDGVLKVSMEGPFVATHRYAAFISDVRYQVNFSNGSSATFKGRTNGRFRGISSNTDTVDALRAFEQINQYQPSHVGAVYDGANVVAVGNPTGVNENSISTSTTNMLPNFPGSGRPIVVSPLSMSGGRSMQFDGTIAVQPQGAQFNRQNIPIPSSMWSDGVNKASKLSCYDVLEPGEEVIVKVTPTHVNNPPFGNISDLIALNNAWTFAGTGLAANNPMPTGSWPFLAGQFDGHEGINDESLYGDTSVTVDRVIRSFDARIILGFKGFRIIAPPGRG